MKDCIPWEGPYAGAEEECKEERAAEMKCYGLTTTLIPPVPVLEVEGDERWEGVFSLLSILLCSSSGQ